MISIIMAAYNEGNYIEECVRSILSQSYRDIELIVTDDGSTDNTAEILDRLAKEDDRLRVFHPGKLGKNGAYNYAAQQVKGEWYVSFCADDILEPGILEAWMKAAAGYDPNTDEVVFASRLRMFATSPAYKRYDGIELPKDLDKVCTSGTAFMASRQIWKKAYPIPNGFPNEDNWIALYFEFFVKKYIPVLMVCTNYRIHSNNSLNKDARYKEFNEKYHKRAIIVREFLQRYGSGLSCDQKRILQRRYDLEMLRYANKTLSILLFRGISLVERGRNLLLSNAFLYAIKLKLNRLLLGW